MKTGLYSFPFSHFSLSCCLFHILEWPRFVWYCLQMIQLSTLLYIMTWWNHIEIKIEIIKIQTLCVQLYFMTLNSHTPNFPISHDEVWHRKLYHLYNKHFQVYQVMDFWRLRSQKVCYSTLSGYCSTHFLIKSRYNLHTCSHFED